MPVVTILGSMIMTMLAKLATQHMLEFAFLFTAKLIVKSTKNEKDDEFYDEVERALKK